MNVTFDDSIHGPDADDLDVHVFGTAPHDQILTGTWNTDGRDHNPLTTTDLSPRNTSLLDFNGKAPDGTWTLVLGDYSSGNTGSLAGWSLEITAVPEPITMALGIFGTLVVGTHATRRWLKRRAV